MTRGCGRIKWKVLLTENGAEAKKKRREGKRRTRRNEVIVRQCAVVGKEVANVLAAFQAEALP